jgi:hypothetical protein
MSRFKKAGQQGIWQQPGQKAAAHIAARTDHPIDCVSLSFSESLRSGWRLVHLWARDLSDRLTSAK